jgi:hypothetical protein
MVCQQEAYVQLVTFQLSWPNMIALFFQSAQQAILSEPVCRLLESLLYGKEGDLIDKTGHALAAKTSLISGRA